MSFTPAAKIIKNKNLQGVPQPGAIIATDGKQFCDGRNCFHLFIYLFVIYTGSSFNTKVLVSQEALFKH